MLERKGKELTEEEEKALQAVDLQEVISNPSFHIKAITIVIPNFP